MQILPVRHSILFGTMLLSLASVANADIAQYYIGYHNFSTLTSGTYNGLPNPNHDRLTFLYSHGDHYHAKGGYSYTGPNLGVGTAINDFNGPFGSSNILPESPLVNDIAMSPGSGVFSGMLRTGLNTAEYNILEIRSVNSPSGFAPGSAEDILLNSSLGRWNGLLNSSPITMNFLSITPGLSIRDSSGSLLADTAGQSIVLGAGNSLNFTPVFTVADSTAIGTSFQAVFNLTDGTGPRGDSGRFIFEVTAVPEPSSMALFGVAMLGGVFRRLRSGEIQS
jgi:PEP-CTERM motif